MVLRCLKIAKKEKPPAYAGGSLGTRLFVVAAFLLLGWLLLVVVELVELIQSIDIHLAADLSDLLQVDFTEQCKHHELFGTAGHHHQLSDLAWTCLFDEDYHAS